MGLLAPCGRQATEGRTTAESPFRKGDGDGDTGIRDYGATPQAIRLGPEDGAFKYNPTNGGPVKGLRTTT